MKIIKTISIFVISILLLAACNNETNNEGTKDPVFADPVIMDISKKIDANPDNAALYYKRGLLLQHLEKDTLALTDFKKAVSLDSGKAEYFSAIGDLLFEHKDLSGSVKWLEKALALNPKDATAHLKVAKMFLYLKEYGSALNEINTVLRQDVYNAESYFLKGMVYKDLKDTAKAISSFQTALQMSPEYYDVILQLGLLHSAKKDPIALKYFDNAWQKDTTDMFPIFAKGVYYQNLGDFARAKQFYADVIFHDREYLDAYFNTGYILIQQDSFEKAWRQYDMLTKISPDNAEAYYNRGFASELMNKKPEAVADYKQALIFNEKYQLPREGLNRLGGE